MYVKYNKKARITRVLVRNRIRRFPLPETYPLAREREVSP
jgi:hypothetical protein